MHHKSSVTNPTPLPITVWRKIAFHLDKKEKAQLAKTSRFFHKVVSEPYGNPPLSLDGRDTNWPKMDYQNPSVYLRTNNNKQPPAYSMAMLAPQLIACGGYDGVIRIWQIDMNETQCIKTLKGHKDSIHVLLKLSDNQLISGGSNGELRLWDIEKETSELLSIQSKENLFGSHISLFGRCVLWLLRHIGFKESFRAIIGMADLGDNLIAVGFANSEIEIWNMLKKEYITTLRGTEPFLNFSAPLQALHYDASTETLKAYHSAYLVHWKVDKNKATPTFTSKSYIDDDLYIVFEKVIVTQKYEILSGYYIDSQNSKKHFILCTDTKTNQGKKIECSSEIHSMALISDDILITSHATQIELWDLKNGALNSLNKIPHTKLAQQLGIKSDDVSFIEMNLISLSQAEVILMAKSLCPLMDYLLKGYSVTDFSILRFSALPHQNAEKIYSKKYGY